jgi:hypothetical protein
MGNVPAADLELEPDVMRSRVRVCDVAEVELAGGASS